MRPPPDDLRFLIQLVFCEKQKKKTMWFIGVEVEQETSAPPPKKILYLPLQVGYHAGKTHRKCGLLLK